MKSQMVQYVISNFEIQEHIQTNTVDDTTHSSNIWDLLTLAEFKGHSAVVIDSVKTNQSLA
jgi:hypothetical protein